ncbi:protein FAM161A-like [Lineus longissimus]|uniref:protein FAM161A-like n=1 Tax=Lineus longissimus TaxID=88925 RepID=UPI002B4D4B25
MATTGIHSLSMFRNGCLKSPVDPRTGLQSSLTDRAKYANEKHNEDPGQGLDSDQENREPKAENTSNSSDFLNSSTSSTTAKLIENLTLGDMSDDEFYNKLMTLKSEHRRTLAMCEKMYEEKLSSEGFGSTASLTLGVGKLAPGPSPTLETMGRDYGLSNEQPVNTSSDTFNQSLEITGLRKSTEKPPRAPRVARDQVRDMGSKASTSHDERHESPRTSESAGRYTLKTAWTEKPSRSDDYWKRISDSSGDEAPDYDRNRYTEHVRNGYEDERFIRSRPQELASAMTRIDDMWDNFSVEEYAPRTAARSTTRSSTRQQPSSRASRSLDRRERPRSGTRDRSNSLEDTWRHRITIPKPFSMTVREETKPKMTSRSIAQYQEEKMKELQEYDAECQKTFKATPVPAHVYLPLFDEINEKAETRRRVNKELSKEVLKSMEKPFKFLKRDESKKSHNCHERTRSAPQKKSKVFKAKPVPNDVYDNTVSERIREEEEYRKIRIKMRAQELQRASSLPPNMAARGSDYVAGKFKFKQTGDKAAKYGIEKEPKFQPKIKEKVPDFERIHRKLQKEMINQKDRKEATVCKPFNLRTSSIERNVDKVVDDMMRDELLLKENRWPYQNSRSRPRSGSIGSLTMDNIPSKLTMSQELRSSANREKIAELTRKEQEVMDKKRRQREKEKQLKKMIAEKGVAVAPEKESPAEKLRKYREAERARREEYEHELQSMKERVDNRPYLFERQSQINARKQAEKRYSATLRSAGVSEEFINKKGSEATDLDYENDDVDDYDDDFNSYSYEKTASRQDTVSRDRQDDLEDDGAASDEVDEDLDESADEA